MDTPFGSTPASSYWGKSLLDGLGCGDNAPVVQYTGKLENLYHIGLATYDVVTLILLSNENNSHFTLEDVSTSQTS